MGKDIFGQDPKGKGTKAKMDKSDYMELKSKGNIIKIKRQPTEWEKIFANYTFNKRLIFRICIGTPKIQ
jgi:hypothetical protein